MLHLDLRAYHIHNKFSGMHGASELVNVSGLACVPQADDRLLQISDSAAGEADASMQFDAGISGNRGGPRRDLVVHHIKPPHQYLAANWPLRHAALSANGLDIAVAGAQERA